MNIDIGIDEITIEAKIFSADGTVRDLGIVSYYRNSLLTNNDLKQLTSLTEDLTKGN